MRLIRWPNLLFIALTQVLFYYCIMRPHLSWQGLSDEAGWPFSTLGILVAASILIAAAGYIINDYFDINIDQVNKPDKMVLEKHVSRRKAILLHLFITLAGLAFSAWAGYRTNWLVLIGNTGCAGLLWFYSTTFKRKLLSGNIIISLLTAWVVLVLYVAVNDDHIRIRTSSDASVEAMKGIFKYAVLYAGFAFIISLIREVVKDIEDIRGDERYECRTMPIVWGIPAAKVFAGVWMVVLTGAVLVLFGYMLLSGWWLAALYALFLLILPLVHIQQLFYRAQDAPDYHKVSSWVKGVMLLGILSMLAIAYHF